MAFWLITKSIKRYGKTSREQSLPVPPRRVTAPPHPKCSSESSGSPQAPAAIKSVLIKYIVVLGELYVAMCVVLRSREVTDMPSYITLSVSLIAVLSITIIEIGAVS